MAGQPQTTLKRVTALAKGGEALWNAVYAAMPINVREYTRIESEVELAWMKAEESVGRARSALDRLADLVKAKAERADGVRQLSVAGQAPFQYRNGKIYVTVHSPCSLVVQGCVWPIEYRCRRSRCVRGVGNGMRSSERSGLRWRAASPSWSRALGNCKLS